jgi:hypothetical protein
MSKNIIDKGFNLNSISGVLNIIDAAFKIPKTPIEPLPSPLVLVGSNLRSGLSIDSITADVISKQSNAGKVVGDVFADGPNVDEAMEYIRVKAIVEAILTEAKIEIVVPPGVPVTTVGVGNLGIPVVSQGVTTGLGIGSGVIR